MTSFSIQKPKQIRKNFPFPKCRKSDFAAKNSNSFAPFPKCEAKKRFSDSILPPEANAA